jgi:hypothetical protein
MNLNTPWDHLKRVRVIYPWSRLPILTKVGFTGPQYGTHIQYSVGKNYLFLGIPIHQWVVSQPSTPQNTGIVHAFLSESFLFQLMIA